MKQIFVLSKQDLELSKQEVLRLYNVKDFELIDNLLVINTNKDYSNRLAYTNEIYDFLFECKEKDLEDIMKNFDWQKIYNKSFSLKADSFDIKTLSSVIWNSVKNPKVNLKNANTKIRIFKTKDNIICGKLVFQNKKGFLKRKAHLRPKLHPTSLDPRLARACINLTGKKGKLLDPFCGSGGILIEAALMDFGITGFDIDENMIKRCRVNLEHCKIKDYNLEIKDSTKLKGKFDCIVTDLPYGKSSKADKNLETLYKNFLEKAYTVTDTAVVIFPDFVNYKSLLGKWKKKLEFNYYLHKNLSKKVVLLCPKPVKD